MGYILIAVLIPVIGYEVVIIAILWAYYLYISNLRNFMPNSLAY